VVALVGSPGAVEGAGPAGADKEDGAGVGFGADEGVTPDGDGFVTSEPDVGISGSVALDATRRPVALTLCLPLIQRCLRPQVHRAIDHRNVSFLLHPLALQNSSRLPVDLHPRALPLIKPEHVYRAGKSAQLIYLNGVP
jgi:hypothetical protein